MSDQTDKTDPTESASTPPPEVNQERDLKESLAVLRAAARELARSQMPRMAAAMAYRTIFGIIPILVIALLVFGSFVNEAEVDKGVRAVLEYAGLSELELPAEDAPPNEAADTPTKTTNPSPTAPSPADPATTALPPLDTTPAEDPAAQPAATDNADSTPATLDEWITSLAKRANEQLRAIPTVTITIISAAVLIYAAVSMLVEIERAFNQIYRAPRGRAWTRRLTLYWTMLTLGSLFLIASIVIIARLQTGEVDVPGVSAVFSQQLLGYLATTGLSVCLLLVAYLTIPNTRVHVRSALSGAAVAALLWEAGKWGFAQYIAFTASGTQRIYGSLALLPLFLLWIYVTWLIVLFGLQVSYSVQHWRTWSGVTRDRQDADVIDPSLALSVAAVLRDAFHAGKPVTAQDISAKTELNGDLARRFLDELKAIDIIHRVDAGDDAGETFALSRPPEAIPAADILDTGFTLADETDQLPAGHAIDKLRHAQRLALQGTTLADLETSENRNSSEKL